MIDDGYDYENYRKSIENSWDPLDIEVREDIEGVKKTTREDYFDGKGFDLLRETLAMFGAAEEAVTEDLAPLAVVEEDIYSQMFITSQLYDESKHTEFFKYYWQEVINEVERQEGLELSSPKEDRFFPNEYHDLFQNNKEAMERLLQNDTPKNRVKAYSNYHLSLEGIVAQTGYWNINETMRDERSPNLQKLLKGVNKIRQDEARHVGFGVNKIRQELKENDDLDISIVKETTRDLLPKINKVFSFTYRHTEPGKDYPIPTKAEVLKRVTGEHKTRLENIKSS